VVTGNKDMIGITVETGNKVMIEIMAETGNKVMIEIMAEIDNKDMIGHKDRAPRLVKLVTGLLRTVYPTVTRTVTSIMVIAISINNSIETFPLVEADQEF
jgi:hypothetical protein